MTEEPVAWQVSAQPNPASIQSIKADIYTAEFKTKEEAEAHKKMVRREGWVVCVTPVYASRRTVVRRNKKAQTNPYPGFNRDWRVHNDEESGNKS